MTTRPPGGAASDDGGCGSAGGRSCGTRATCAATCSTSATTSRRSYGCWRAVARPCSCPSHRPRPGSSCGSSRAAAGALRLLRGRRMVGRGGLHRGAGRPRQPCCGSVESWVLRGASVVLAVSTGVADQLRWLGVDPQRVVVVGNGVDTEHLLAARGRPTGPGPYFVYTGTMSEWQGADVSSGAGPCTGGPTPTPAGVPRAGERPAHLERLADELAPGPSTSWASCHRRRRPGGCAARGRPRLDQARARLRLRQAHQDLRRDRVRHPGGLRGPGRQPGAGDHGATGLGARLRRRRGRRCHGERCRRR